MELFTCPWHPVPMDGKIVQVIISKGAFQMETTVFSSEGAVSYDSRVVLAP